MSDTVQRHIRWRRPSLPWRRYGADRRLSAIDPASTAFAWVVALAAVAVSLIVIGFNRAA